MNSKKQKLIIENLLSSVDIFSKTISIIKPQYFDPEYQPVVKFITNYFEKYNNLPLLPVVEAEHGIKFSSASLTKDQIDYTSTEIEKFCKESALTIAIYESMEEITKGNTSSVYDKVTTALAVGLPKTVGVNIYDETEIYLRGMLDSFVYESTGIPSLDMHLNGGLARKQTTLFSGNSGVGKSLVMLNIGLNYAMRGKNVLNLSLELDEPMIYLRAMSILSNINASKWKENIVNISVKIQQQKSNGAGSFVIKRIDSGANANDIKTILKFYELQNGYMPDVVITDYLDLMTPNGGTHNKDLSTQDKEKSEQLVNLGFTHNLFNITASQQNRSGLDATSLTQGVIGGGYTKIHPMDNFISLYADPPMQAQGRISARFLKTRSSSGVGNTVMLQRDNNTLRIFDGTTESKTGINIIRNKKETIPSTVNKPIHTSFIQDLPNCPTEPKNEVINTDTQDLTELMSSIQGL